MKLSVDKICLCHGLRERNSMTTLMLCVTFQQDNLSFPLICPDWNADEEILLLEVAFIL